MLVATDASVIANFAVAAGTAALAVGTFVLALSARAQARDTKRLAEASERQVAWMAREGAAVTMPRLRIRSSDGGEPDVEISEGRIRAVYVNHGSVPAQVLEVGPEDAGGFAETDPVPPGGTTVAAAPIITQLGRSKSHPPEA
jgi:hypothetical protein